MSNLVYHIGVDIDVKSSKMVIAFRQPEFLLISRDYYDELVNSVTYPGKRNDENNTKYYSNMYARMEVIIVDSWKSKLEVVGGVQE